MKLKKTAAILLSVLSIGALTIGFSACAEKDLAYRLSEDQSYYVVVGIGEVTDEHVVIKSEYKGKPVKEIGEDAFDYYEKMTSVTIPDTVEIIGAQAFAYCKNLEEVHFGSGVQTIEQYAFLNCSKLSEVSFGDQLAYVGEQAFYLCPLETVTFGEGQTQIGNGVFKDCKTLTSLDLGNVKSVGEECFLGCTGLTTLQLNHVETLKQYAFGSCTGLTEVDLGDSLTHGLSNAFNYCRSLQKVFAPASLIFIDTGMFSGCNKLQAIYLKATKEECAAASALKNYNLFYYAESNPFEGANVTYGDSYWHYDEQNQPAIWNKNVGSSCAIVYAGEQGNYSIPVSGSTITDVRFNGETKSEIRIEQNGLTMDKAFLYQNAGVNHLSWLQDGLIHIYTLKVVQDGVINFENGDNSFLKVMSAAKINGVVDTTPASEGVAATGNGEKTLQLTSTGSGVYYGSIYIGLDADYVHALFANDDVNVLKFHIYTPYDLRQKLSWYYETASSGNQITTEISYMDKGDYLLIQFTRDGYDRWSRMNTYKDTDVLQFLFRFTRDVQEGESPSTNGIDKDSQYVWVQPGTFYLDDFMGAEKLER